MSFISDFFEGVKDSIVPGLIAAAATFIPGVNVAAWAAFTTTVVAGGASRALAKDPAASLGGAADITVSTRSPTASRRLVYGKRRIGGTIVYTHATDGGSQLHYIIALCEGPIEAIDEIYFNDEIAVQANGTVVSKYSGIVQVDKKLGTASQTASALAVQETPDAGNGAWTNDHRLRGVAYIYVELSFDRDKFPQGVPNISAVVRGRNDITDPRDASVGYTTNPALVLKHYIEDPKYGLNATVDDAAVQVAADVCDQQVSLKSGGTENRYTLNGIVDSADEPMTILNDIANSMAGYVTFTGGKWRMQAGTHPALKETAQDSTTNDNDGTLVNGPTWVSDGPNENIRGALSFNNADSEWVQVADDAALDITGSVLIEAWIKPPPGGWNVSASNCGIVSRGRPQSFFGSTGNTGYHLGIRASDNSILVTCEGEDNNTFGSALTADQWTFVSVLFDGANNRRRIYYNAALNISHDRTVSLSDIANDLGIANTPDAGGSRFFKGPIADARVWDVTGMSLSAIEQQIQDNMNTRLNGDESGLVGYWRLDDGSPAMELTEDHMLSDLSVTTRASRRERFNSVRGTFVSASNDYQPADFPAYKDTSAITEDNGEVIWQDIELPYTATASMAQRLARIDVERMRREILVEGLFDLSALQLIAGDVIELTDDQFGWDKKQFEVVDMDTDFSESPGVALTLRETDSGVYSWSSADEQETTQAPETDFPDPFTVAAPTNVQLFSGDAQLFPKKDGTIVSRIKATWDQSSGTFIDRYQVQYKKSADADWTNSGDVDDDNRVAFIWDVEDDVNYDVRVRGVNQLGIRSAWEPALNHTVQGKTTPPPNPETFNVTALSDGTRYFEFTLSSPPADLAGFEVRFIAGSSTDYDAMTPLTPQGRLVFSPFESNDVPSGLHSFGVKAVDTSGNYSTGALFIEADLPLPRLAGVLLQRFEKSLQWPGTLNSMFRDTDNSLYAVAATDGTWADSGPDWSSAGPEWYSWTNRESPVSYETEVMDLGADAAFTPRALVSAVGSVTREMKTGTDADGGVVGSYVALASVTARYIQIRVTITGATPILRNLTTLLDGAVEQTTREDVDVATESSVWFNKIATGHFQVAASADTEFLTRAQVIAFQSITVPHTWSLESKSAVVNGNPAAEFKLFDNNGNLVDATVDIELNGPKAA